MSASGPDLPRDPAEYRPRPLIGVGFWAFIAFGVLCVLAGAGVVLLGPKLWAPKPAAPAVQAPPAKPLALATPPPLAAPAVDVAEVAAGEVSQLRARIAALETKDARSADAAGAAMAAMAVMQLSQGRAPFAAELAAIHRDAPGLPISDGLMQLAAAGAPTRAELALSFPQAAAQASLRARRPPDGAGLGDQLAYAAARVVTIRRVDDLSETTPDSLLAAAEFAVNRGDVGRAVALVDRLPAASRAALAGWRDGAVRRAAIDREAATLRERVARDLGVGRPVT